MVSQSADLQAVLERLEKVEGQTRWINGMGFLVLSLSGCIFLMGQTRPQSRTVEAESFVLVDPAGKVRATMAIANGGPALKLYGREKIGAAFYLTEDQSGLDFYDQAGKGRIALGWSRSSSSLGFVDETGKPELILGSSVLGPSLRLFDEAGSWRASLEFTPPRSALALFGDDKLPRVILDSTQGLQDLTH